jgi:hypothetical protein
MGIECSGRRFGWLPGTLSGEGSDRGERSEVDAAIDLEKDST